MKASAPSARKSYHHGDLRNALLEAGLEILDREGIAAVTLRAIAAHAGVSHAAPAHHFGNLKGLMTALAAIAFDRLHGAIEAAMREAVARPLEQVRAAGRGYVDFACNNAGLFRLMFNSSLIDNFDPALRHAGDRAYQQLLSIAEIAAEARGEKGAAEVSATAMQIWCSVHGFAHLLLEGQIDAPPDGNSPVSRLPDIGELLVGGANPCSSTSRTKRL